jgi:hypothetical protein
MSDLTIEPDFAEHPKVFELSDAAFRAHIKAMCWCAKFESDGQMPSRVANQFAPGELMSELVAGRLWVANEDGSFAIRDYLEYNPSREELAAERARKKRRPARGKSGAHGGEKTPRGGAQNLERHKPIREEESSVRDQIPDPETQPDNVGSVRGRRWRRVPSEWSPEAAHYELAKSVGANMGHELESFRDHEFKDPKTDANAAFRTWLRNSKKFSPRGAPQRTGPKQPNAGQWKPPVERG